MTRMLFGVITAVRPPDDPLNVNKLQYEYDVDVDHDVGTKVPTRHNVRADMFGSLDEYDDNTLRVANRVVMLFPDDALTRGVIIGCLRNTGRKMDRSKGAYRETRFNKVTETTDKSGHWSLKLDQGETILLTKSAITIRNGSGEEVTMDRSSKTISVKAGKDWKATLGGSMQVTAKAKIELTCKDATVKATGKVKITGGTVDINAATSPVTTEQSHQGVVDLITGVPVIGVKKVKAG